MHQKIQEMESMAANDETLGNEEQLNPSVAIRPGNQRNYGSTGPSIEAEIHQAQQTQQQEQTSQNTDSGSKPEGPTKPGIKRVKSFITPYLEDRLCRELKFFFMGPDEKIKARRRVPWKLLVQVLKIILVTAQLIQFGYSRSSFVEFTSSTLRTMQHLYIKKWDNTYETMPYPPAVGKYALYRIEELTQHLNFALQAYDETRDSAIGSLRYYLYPNGTRHPMRLCLEHYTSGIINDTDDTYNIDSTITYNCYNVETLRNGTADIKRYLREHYNMTIDYDRLLIATLKFSLKSFRLDVNERNFPPQLFRVDVKLKFDDGNRDGQMLVTMKADLTEIEVKGHSTNEATENRQKIGTVILDSFVLLFTVLSILLCSRSVWRAQVLRRKTVHFFKHHYGKNLSASDQCEFLNLWYVTIIINDALTIVGTGYKIELETRNLKSSSSNYDVAGLMLGTGSLLAWLGVLRYIGFFKQFNVLILTLKQAFPRLLQFLLSCFLLYMGFVVCGWVVLGPYHLKFKEIGITSECLFSMINGDDIFGTFAGLETNSELVWYYSRIYLYSFSALFIYAVLNLFIAVIMDTYETIKEYYEHGFPKSELFKFIDTCQDPLHSDVFRQEHQGFTICNWCCCTCDSTEYPEERILIVTLRKAIPNMARFLVCCFLLYMGFVICGWVVLGPYHIKFKSMSTASECLFSLVNGDDMFVTFSATMTDNPVVWYYSRFYLYIFISLFIYAVLNLFIAVIMDSYETIKEYYEHGFPKGELFEFIDKCQDPAHSSIYQREDPRRRNPLHNLCCCCGPDPDHVNEYTSIIN